MNKDQLASELIFTQKWLDKTIKALDVVNKSDHKGNFIGTIEAPNFENAGLDKYIPISVSKETFIDSLEYQKKNWQWKLDKLNKEIPL